MSTNTGAAGSWRWRRDRLTEAAAPLTILVLGGIERGLWIFLRNHSAHPPRDFASGEIANVAIAFARTGVLADPFGAPSGPTAHVLPLPPVYAGLVYRFLGVRAPMAEAVLAINAIVVANLTFALAYLIFRELGLPRRPALAALATLCLLPVNFTLEAIEFRIWEGSLAVLLALAYLYALVRCDAFPRLGIGATCLLGLGAAVVFFVSPPLGLGAYCGLALLVVRRVEARHWVRAGIVASAALALVIAPWAWRNLHAMGAMIPLRSNAGLELGIGNHAAAAAASSATEAAVARARLETIHPYQSRAAFAEMIAVGGEVGYARRVGDTAMAWIRAHPGEFIGLSLRHLRQFLFPPPWFWNVGYDRVSYLWLRCAFQWLLMAFAIAGAALVLRSSERRYRYVVLMFILPMLPYGITQPVLRYRYILSALTVFLAAELLSRVVRRFAVRVPVPTSG